jgi:hypothetical protein
MITKNVPQSAPFAFDVARGALREQLSRIDSLDSKAGILLAADGILAGLIFGRGELVMHAPRLIAASAGVSVLGSLACALRAFAGRNYQLAPKPDEVARLAAALEDWLRWNFMGNVLEAVDRNRVRLEQKFRWLSAGQFLLLVALAPVGGYFVYALATEAT